MYKVGDVVNVPFIVIGVGKVKYKNDVKEPVCYYILKPVKTDFEYVIDNPEDEDEL